METEVRSESFRDKREEIGVESLQFGEEIRNLITLPTETDSSFTALLELPANQAVKLLHSRELHENTAKFSGDVWSSSVIEHAKLSDCFPIFPANAELIDRASKFSVFAATGNSPDMVKQEQFASESNPTSSPVMSEAIVLDNNRKSTKRKERENKVKGSLKKSKNVANESSKDSEKLPYVHVRARRGQATDSHSLAERARREKINARMKLLQELVPGCNKISGTALVLDEIINHVQSLQRQVEFLSMRLAAVNPGIDVNLDSLLAAESGSLIDSNFPGMVTPSMWVEGQLYGNRHHYQQQLWPQFDGAHQPVWSREDNSLLSYDSSANSDHYVGPTSLPSNQLKMEL